MCTKCQRWLNDECIENNNLDTDEDEDIYYTGIVKKRKITEHKTKYSNLYNHVYHLCRKKKSTKKNILFYNSNIHDFKILYKPYVMQANTSITSECILIE